MDFLVHVRWHPNEEAEPCSAAWIVESVSGDCYHLVLHDKAGIEHRIPLALIERVEMERKG